MHTTNASALVWSSVALGTRCLLADPSLTWRPDNPTRPDMIRDVTTSLCQIAGNKRVIPRIYVWTASPLWRCWLSQQRGVTPALHTWTVVSACGVMSGGGEADRLGDELQKSVRFRFATLPSLSCFCFFWRTFLTCSFSNTLPGLKSTQWIKHSNETYKEDIISRDTQQQLITKVIS